MPKPSPNRKNKRRRKRRMRPKICRFCEDDIRYVHFTDTATLSRYVTPNGRILPRRITGNCYVHQKMLTAAVKRARNLALVP